MFGQECLDKKWSPLAQDKMFFLSEPKFWFCLELASEHKIKLLSARINNAITMPT